MFSEYASRFLAQSQSRVVNHPEDPRRKGHERLLQQPRNSLLPSSRSFFHRNAADPYQPAGSQLSGFPFGSRVVSQPAPLFYSATDEFREEDDEVEHEREIADFYALQKSRRQFGSSYLRESSEIGDDNESASSKEQQPPYTRGKGIWSSWRDAETSDRAQDSRVEYDGEPNGTEESIHTERSRSRLRGKLVDVHLEDTLASDVGRDRADSPGFGDDKPPSVQRFREQPQSRTGNLGLDSVLLPIDSDNAVVPETSQPPGTSRPYRTSTPPVGASSPAHDGFWGHLFLISVASLFATSFLIYLDTSPPSGDKSKWGDTVYLTIHSSFYLLGTYTIVSISISLLWLALLRSYVRPLVYAILVAVPIILYSFFLYPFISSFGGVWHGSSVQDKVMRCGSIIPFILASAWIYNVVRGRRAIGRAVDILEFACRILAVNPELLALGLGALILIVLWTWLWMLMFTRVFLEGHISRSSLFVVDSSSWCLGIYYVLVYAWSLGVIAGIRRTVTAAAVSQWYFHRFTTPAPTSRQIVQAATLHSATTLFGTICLSSLLALMIRVPLLLLPGRIASLLSFCAYSFVPTPITALTDPLTLTYASIHSQPLTVSARGLVQMTNLTPSIATTSLHPRSFSWSRGHSATLLPYRLSKLILHAARLMMSLALGFGGWVSTARSLSVMGTNGSIRGSMYAYMVGIIAGTIGWSVLGAIEGVIADTVDASIICWSSEVGAYGREARYCREAGWLFGQEPGSVSRNTRFEDP
ncbi:ctl transporter [Aspergillus costaricaensis CBS 115574]|uniref:Ctl transporter n=1 Tax=Aspergillus costaricaensis CBS 115574 TaxID=1448317 RepID=A0ACD1HZG4_9EURO|nr:ctl transporter [Aspergillus costaricaensis CBS 115574]RAK83463.1 ctl transporter [Aspergillus costaricaensis CBS 115574]